MRTTRRRILKRIFQRKGNCKFLLTWPALLLAAMLISGLPLLAHSWYPFACCGDMDCFPVACEQLVQTLSGWLYIPTGNLFSPEQVQPSHDDHCHVCVGNGGDHRSICAFIVPNA